MRSWEELGRLCSIGFVGACKLLVGKGRNLRYRLFSAYSKCPKQNISAQRLRHSHLVNHFVKCPPYTVQSFANCSIWPQCFTITRGALMNMNIRCSETIVHPHMINDTWKRPATSNANSDSKGRCSMLPDIFVQENHPLSSNI